MGTQDIVYSLQTTGELYDHFIDENITDFPAVEYCTAFGSLESYTLAPYRTQHSYHSSSSGVVGHYHEHETFDYGSLGGGGGPGAWDQLHTHDIMSYGIFYGRYDELDLGVGWYLVPGSLKLRFNVELATGSVGGAVYIADVRDTAYNWSESVEPPPLTSESTYEPFTSPLVPWSAFSGFTVLATVTESGDVEVSLPDSWMDSNDGLFPRFFAWNADIANASCKAGDASYLPPSASWSYDDHARYESRATISSFKIAYTRTDTEQPVSPPEPSVPPEEEVLGISPPLVRVYVDGY